MVNLLVAQMISVKRVQQTVRNLIGRALSEAIILKYLIRRHDALHAWEQPAIERLTAHACHSCGRNLISGSQCIDGRFYFDHETYSNMVHSSVPEQVAMTISGHKTRAILGWYKIVGEGDLIAAAKKQEDDLKNSVGHNDPSPK